MSRDEELSQAAKPYLDPLEEWLNQVNKLKSLEMEMEKRYRELLEEYDKKCAELEGEKANARMWRNGHGALEAKLSSLKAATVSFVVAHRCSLPEMIGLNSIMQHIVPL